MSATCASLLFILDAANGVSPPVAQLWVAFLDGTRQEKINACYPENGHTIWKLSATHLPAAS